MTLAAALQPSGAIKVLPTPTRRDLAADEVRIRVSRIGVNYWEVLQRHGRVGPPSAGILGSEGCGRVIEVGGQVTPVRAGDRVAWFRVPGSFASELIAPATACYLVPDEVDDDTAAGLLFQGATALYLVEETWPLDRGAHALVTAAAGGVGHLLVQLLRHRGARVTALASDAAKLSVAVAAGAELALTYSEAAGDERLSQRFAAVYDSLGGAFARQFLSWMQPRGCIVEYGASSGAEANIDAGDLVAGSLFMTRTAGRDYIADSDSAQRRAAALLDLAAAGAIYVHSAESFSLQDAAAALDALESRTSTGKILLVP